MTKTYLATIVDRENFGEVRKQFVCDDQGRANYLAGAECDRLLDAEGQIGIGRFKYQVVPVEVLR